MSTYPPPAAIDPSATARQRDQKLDVVGLNGRLVRGAVAAYMAAFLAFMDDDVSASRICFNADRPHDAAAFGGSVAGVDVDVQRAKASRTMVPRRISERFDLKPAVCADEALIVFAKSFLVQFRILL